MSNQLTAEKAASTAADRPQTMQPAESGLNAQRVYSESGTTKIPPQFTPEQTVATAGLPTATVTDTAIQFDAAPAGMIGVFTSDHSSDKSVQAQNARIEATGLLPALQPGNPYDVSASLTDGAVGAHGEKTDEMSIKKGLLNVAFIPDKVKTGNDGSTIVSMTNDQYSLQFDKPNTGAGASPYMLDGQIRQGLAGGTGRELDAHGNPVSGTEFDYVETQPGAYAYKFDGQVLSGLEAGAVGGYVDTKNKIYDTTSRPDIGAYGDMWFSPSGQVTSASTEVVVNNGGTKETTTFNDQ